MVNKTLALSPTDDILNLSKWHISAMFHMFCDLFVEPFSAQLPVMSKQTSIGYLFIYECFGNFGVN
jgi:hypothetical protein